MKKHLPLLLGLTAFALYMLTGSRSIQWQDSGQFTLRVGTGTLYNDWGLAMAHPLHFMLGRLCMMILPGNVPWAVTMASAIGGSLAVGVVAACVRRWTDDLQATLYAGLALMLAHTFWRFSGLPEVYTISAALLALQAYCLIREYREGDAGWWVPLMGFNGLSWANHNLALLELAVLGPAFLHAWYTRRLPHRVAFAAIGFWLVGSLPYTSLILMTMVREQTFFPVVRSALFGYNFKEQVTGFRVHPAHTAVTLAFTALSFPGPALILAARAGWSVRKMLPVFLGMLALHLVFVLRYDVIDQYTFLIAAFAGFAILAGIGFHQLRSPKLRGAFLTLVLLQPLLYAVTPALARATGVLTAFERAKPYRDDAEYLLWPWTFQETSAARMADDAVSAAAPDGVLVVEDSMGVYAVEWTLHERGVGGVILLRPGQLEEILEALTQGRKVVRVPARTDREVPPDVEVRGSVWVQNP